MNVGRCADKAECDPVGLLLQCEVDVHAILFGHRRDGQLRLRQIHSLSILKNAAYDHARSHSGLCRVDHFQLKQPVIQQDPFRGLGGFSFSGTFPSLLNAGWHFPILDRYSARLPDHFLGCQYQFLTRGQPHTARLHLTDPKLWALQVDQNGNGPVLFLRNFTNCVNVASMEIVVAMAHINARHIHARIDHCREDFRISA